ncbi:helix-turn-helix domain-containing protein [Pedobacter mucosus]|uniref:helix-turn-helix domain-containing protein n=1 Tax=Pedobacter mucosus TaxID=2895286 RepID=UPI001EE42902|nr:helix-turn-helix domain-containing protein [Pedobacter mucosus]UKT64669.1 helix-turn-helix transcriptional regulator [Pedobacter mucosus]
MKNRKHFIPVNAMANEFGFGIAIERINIDATGIAEDSLIKLSEEAEESHRHDGHAFFLLEKGRISVEIDFEQYEINAPSIMYVHPDQVHSTKPLENIVVSSLAIDTAHLNTEYLLLLNEIYPAKPILLNEEIFCLFETAMSQCIAFSKYKNERLFPSLIRDSCNAIAALMISQYLKAAKPTDNLTRFETVSRAFKTMLEKHYLTIKRPSDFAEKLNISTSYLNECVKHTTGFSPSRLIQDRIILEAKRLLHYGNKSSKEIALALGYADPQYFSRLFAKSARMTTKEFKSRNRE